MREAVDEQVSVHFHKPAGVKAPGAGICASRGEDPMRQYLGLRLQEIHNFYHLQHSPIVFLMVLSECHFCKRPSKPATFREVLCKLNGNRSGRSSIGEGEPEP